MKQPRISWARFGSGGWNDRRDRSFSLRGHRWRQRRPSGRRRQRNGTGNGSGTGTGNSTGGPGGTGDPGVGGAGGDAPPPPPPFQASSAASAVRKVKRLLTGMAPTDQEMMSGATADGLRTLITTWTTGTDFQPRSGTR